MVKRCFLFFHKIHYTGTYFCLTVDGYKTLILPGRYSRQADEPCKSMQPKIVRGVSQTAMLASQCVQAYRMGIASLIPSALSSNRELNKCSTSTVVCNIQTKSGHFSSNVNDPRTPRHDTSTLLSIAFIRRMHLRLI
jgi:hypothetical protein